MIRRTFHDENYPSKDGKLQAAQITQSSGFQMPENQVRSEFAKKVCNLYFTSLSVFDNELTIIPLQSQLKLNFQQTANLQVSVPFVKISHQC